MTIPATIYSPSRPLLLPARKTLDIGLLPDKVDWKIQLNVRNLFDEDDLVPVGAQPTGEVAAVRIPQSRTWTLQSTFSF